jgi:hypothetical protein
MRLSDSVSRDDGGWKRVTVAVADRKHTYSPGADDHIPLRQPLSIMINAR